MLKKSARLLHPNWWQGSTCRARYKWCSTCLKSALLSSHRNQRAPLVFEQKPILVGKIYHPGGSQDCWPDRARGGLLPCGCNVLASLSGNKEGSKDLMVPRVKPALPQFVINNLFTPMDSTPLRSIPSVCRLWGPRRLLACARREI